MTSRSEPVVGVVRLARRAVSISGWLDRESVFSWLMMAPPLLFLAALVGYPFLYGILLSLQNRPVAHAGTFVGLKNFANDINDPIFWKVTFNTFLYTAAATLLKMVGGLALALAMNQQFPLKNLVRALMLLPFIGFGYKLEAKRLAATTFCCDSGIWLFGYGTPVWGSFSCVAGNSALKSPPRSAFVKTVMN